MKLPPVYKKFRQRVKDDIIFFGNMHIELFNDSNLEFEQDNSALTAGASLKNHEQFDPLKHLIIAAGPYNEPWFINATDPNTEVYRALPTKKLNGVWTVYPVSNSLEDLALTMEYIQEVEKEMMHQPDLKMLHIIFDKIIEINKDADIECWEVWLAEGEYWVEHGKSK